MSGGGNEDVDPSRNGPIPLHEITTAEARRYADLVGIAHDIDRVRSFIDAWLKTADPVLQDALFTAALIAYRRCFTTGVRQQLDSTALAVLGEGAVEYHCFMMDQASKLTAHPVNAFEQVKIGVIVQDGTVAGSGLMIGRMMSFQREGFVRWGSFVHHLSELVVRPMLDAAKDAAVESARRLPISDIVASPTIRVTVPPHSHASKRRT